MQSINKDNLGNNSISQNPQKTSISNQPQNVSVTTDSGKPPQPKCSQYHAACRQPNENESICTLTANHQGKHHCGKCGWNF